MSKIAWCKNGGSSGILVTEKELGDMATGLGRKNMDEVIPLPDISFGQQCIRLEEDINNGGPARHNEHGQQYWEVEETGSGGWCCTYCGTVVQWGRDN